MKRRRFDPANASVLEVAYVKTGSMLKAARVVAFISAWGVARRELGPEMTIDQFAEFWNETRSTAFRHQALFRETFTLCQTPDPVLDAMERASSSERLDWRELVVA